MPDFLREMERTSRARVRAARQREPEAALCRRARVAAPAPPLRLLPAGFDLIAEVKRRSPSGRRLAPARAGIAARARAYADAGAAAVSVLTEPTRFGGALAHVAEAACGLPVPVLRKDFLVEPYQLFEARAAGAGGALLIAALLDEMRLAEMVDAAAEAGLFVLVEAFTARDAALLHDLARRSTGTLLGGVNARDLATLGTDTGKHAELVGALPPGLPRVAESGLHTASDAARVAALGYELALVGTAAMLADDPASLVAAMLAAGRAARGRVAGRTACASA